MLAPKTTTSPAIILKTHGIVSPSTFPAIILHFSTQTIYRFTPTCSKSAYLPFSIFKLTTALLSAETQTMFDLINFLYFNDPDGGPENPSNNIRTYKCEANKRLSPLAIEIELIRYNLYGVIIHDLP